MCGIAGELSCDGATPVDAQVLARMGDALAHRGPDGEGSFREGPVGLAFRRLALVDVAGGAQPVRSEDGRIVAIVNGELYDHAAHRDALRARGHAFVSGSDAEVVVHLYEEHGPGFVGRLRGMFALALWDAREQRLLLARDPFGIKPLVYAQDRRRLAFASEAKALLARGDVGRDVDPAALADYLSANAVLAPRTMWAQIRRLAPGHLLLAAPGEAPRLVRYARPAPAPATGVRRDRQRALAAELRARLGDSVAAHLMGDVPVGVLLSGGVDSGGLCALAAARTGPGLPTFSVGFEERSFDELERARLVARRYATAHTEVVVRAQDAADHLLSAAASLDEPRGDATEVPYRLAARAAAADVKAVLSGEGGDELFGGYPTYTADHLGPGPARVAAVLAPAVARLARSSDARLSLEFRLHRLARGAGLGPLGRHHAWKELLGARERGALLGRAVACGPPAAYAARWAETAGAPLVARLQDVDVGTFLADDLLLQTDRSGMAHGLEIRVPYLDREVAALALALPTGAKLRGLETKRLLRAALAPLLPDAIVHGPKKGFVAPAAAWLRGPLEPLARDVLSPETLRRQGFLAPRSVQALLERHCAREEDLSRPLWALIAFGLWVDAHGAHPAASGEVPASVTPAEPVAS